MTAAPQQLRLITSPGVELLLESHVADGGGPDTGALPVLLLHGLSQQGRFWGPVIRRLRSRPVATLDQRGHGESDTPTTADYAVEAFARDALAALELLGWDRSVVVGHSWGASVALSAAAIAPDRIAAAVLVDGGLWSAAGLGPRAEIRARLTPPALGIPEDDLWGRISSGDLGPAWSDEVRSALAPTFVVDDAGLARTRLGMERHLLVLDGLLDHEPDADLAACESSGVPVWAAVCQPRDDAPPPGGDYELWLSLKQASATAAAQRSNTVVHRWPGAVHDVPLQWPALVAGFVDTVVEDTVVEDTVIEGREGA